MKARLLIVTVLYLLLFWVTGLAQEKNLVTRPSPHEQQLVKMGMKNSIRSEWNGSLSGPMQWLSRPEFREGWNISDEQYRQIEDVIRGERGRELYMQNPEIIKIHEEENICIRSLLMENADEETMMAKSLEFSERRNVVGVKLRNEAVENLLTAEQKRKIQEFQLATMEKMSFVSSGMFEALDLTENQKQEMEKIKKELEPEFERILENFVNGQQVSSNKIFDEREKQGDYDKDTTTIHEKLLAEDPEYKRIHEERQFQGKLFAIQLKIKMFDVLTDEQWDRLQELIDNPPEYYKAFLQRVQKPSGESETTKPWQPGPDSWKPGDGIPEQYRQERNERRFPVRKVN